MAKKVLLFMIFLMVLSCNEDTEVTSRPTNQKECRGEWNTTDSQGNLKKYKETWNSYAKECFRENIPLSQWEKSLEKRKKHDVQCTPQVDIPNLWLRSSNNYYSYRNNRIFLELDASTGEARKLIVGELDNGEKSFKREIFCFYIRTDIENEPVNPHNYGDMILFDSELGASSRSFHPMEIYNYETLPNGFSLTMMNNNHGVGWTWCPTRKTPWGFCDELRNGNIMFYPDDPDATTQDKLLAAAKLIRSEYNFIEITQKDFESVWKETVSNDIIEVGTQDYIEYGGTWKYMVTTIFDEPLFIGRAWREYLRGDRPYMPDVAGASSMGMPYVCYQTKKEVTLDSGERAFIDGEACYEDGVYKFIND